MRKLSKISESIFNAGIDRNQGNSVRKEDEINWIDFGDFYIADRLYSKDGNIYFTYNETMKMFPEGKEIELPNEDIISKLKCTKVGNEVCISGPNNKEITLPLSGANNYPESKTQTIVWIYGVSKNHPDENVRCGLFRGKEVSTHDIVNRTKVCILLIKKKKMNESIFNAGVERNQGNDKKQEDKSRFDEAFNKIKDDDFIEIPDSKYLWSKVNFGADKFDEPGLYLSSSDIKDLGYYLEGTEYKIASYTDWYNYTYNLLFHNSQLVKIGDKNWDSLLLNIRDTMVINDDECLYIPNFGYISRITNKLTFDNGGYYGYIDSEGHVGYTKIGRCGKYLVFKQTINYESYDSDKVQIRLIKKK